MTISEQLIELNNIKTSIKGAIEDKGVEIPSDSSFASYATFIGDIQTGGNNEDITVISNGVYTAGENYDGLGTVTVNVPQKSDLLIDEVTRTVTTKSRGRVPAQLGVTQTGGTMTDDFVYTCASNAYLLADRVFPFDIADTWELYFKYKWAGKNGENITGDDYKAPCIYISGNKISVWLSSNGSSWDIGSADSGSFTLTSGTTYYFRLGFNGTEYYIDYNLDGSDAYTRIVTKASTSKLYVGSDPIRFANAYVNNYGLTQRYCTGQLYLQDTKLYVNDELYWQAVTPAGEWQDL